MKRTGGRLARQAAGQPGCNRRTRRTAKIKRMDGRAVRQAGRRTGLTYHEDRSYIVGEQWVVYLRCPDPLSFRPPIRPFRAPTYQILTPSPYPDPLSRQFSTLSHPLQIPTPFSTRFAPLSDPET
jgi:hypothetical protein